MISAAKKKKLDSECRAYVVGRGKLSGHEHLTGYRATDGKRLGTSTNGRVNAVSVTPQMSQLAKDKRAKVVVHHNHPGGTSLSREDLHNLGRLPGTLEVHAHGHARQWYCAESRRERRFQDFILAADDAFDRCLWGAGGTSVPDELHNHLFNLGFSAAGAIRYEHKLDKRLAHMYNTLSSVTRRDLEQAVVEAVKAERSRR